MHPEGAFMAISWNENLIIGVPVVDDQHKEIFARFDKLSLACQNQHGSEGVKELLSYLHDYVAAHFAAEEALMEMLNYPGLAVQSENHAAFKKDIIALFDESEQGVDGHRLSLEVDRRLVQWFILHIRNLDSEMADFVNAQRKSSPQRL